MQCVKRACLIFLCVLLLLPATSVTSAHGATIKEQFARMRDKTQFNVKLDDYARWQWKNKALTFAPQIVNDCAQDIIAYTVDIYCLNVYDEIIYSTDGYTSHLQFTIDATVGAGKTKYAPYLDLSEFKHTKIKYVNAAVVKYRMKDGTIREQADDEYSYSLWEIK